MMLVLCHRLCAALAAPSAVVRRRALAVPLLVLTFAATGCAGSVVAGSAANGPERRGNGIVLDRSELRDNSMLLGALRGRVGNLRIAEGGACPQLYLRGPSRIQGSSDPGIYVDGARAVNTCILEQMRTEDVDRVEVYPSGVASQPGYRNHPHGLILIFLRGA